MTLEEILKLNNKPVTKEQLEEINKNKSIKSVEFYGILYPGYFWFVAETNTGENRHIDLFLKDNTIN